jgi:hypothetical protein
VAWLSGARVAVAAVHDDAGDVAGRAPREVELGAVADLLSSWAKGIHGKSLRWPRLQAATKRTGTRVAQRFFSHWWR